MGVIPLLAAGLFLQGFFLLAFPQWEGASYQLVSLALICAGAGGVFFFLKVLQVKSMMVAASYYLGFMVAVLMFFLFTWPCRPLPIQQFGQGYRPTRADAADGLRRLGFDPNSGASKAIAAMFPKR